MSEKCIKFDGLWCLMPLSTIEKNRVPGENHHIKFDLAMQKILSETKS